MTLQLVNFGLRLGDLGLGGRDLCSRLIILVLCVVIFIDSGIEFIVHGIELALYAFDFSFLLGSRDTEGLCRIE